MIKFHLYLNALEVTERNVTKSVDLVNDQFSGLKWIEAVDGTNWHKIIHFMLQILFINDWPNYQTFNKSQCVWERSISIF